jgi:uncharacterized protein
MTAAALLALIIVGFAVGFLAGLVGIGGGVLIVPFLYFFYAHSGWSGVDIPSSLHPTVAAATSLFIIIPTALAGTATYARSGLVAWRTALPVAAFSVVFAAAAALLAARMPPEFLKVAFGTFLILTAINLLTRRSSAVSGPPRTNLVAAGATGALVGIFSALLGVGGGLVAIPMLMYVVRLDLRHIAATSLAIVAFAATAGTLTYMFTGAGVPLPRAASASCMSPPHCRCCRGSARRALGRTREPADGRPQTALAVRRALRGARRKSGHPQPPPAAERVSSLAAENRAERPAIPPAGALIVAVLAISWGGPLVRFATAPALAVSAWRLLLAVAFIAIVLLVRRAPMPVSQRATGPSPAQQVCSSPCISGAGSPRSA